MITKSQILYTSILSSILGGGGLGYYFLSGSNASPEVQSSDGLNSENPITVTNDGSRATQHEVIEETSAIQQYDPKDIDIQFSDGNDWIKRPVTHKHPEWASEPHLVTSAERIKKEDPVLYRYHYDNPFQKTFDLEYAKKKMDVLMDHSLMLAYSSGCSIGTGWIFDYVLPKGNQKYPTKFFIASDGHVVNAIKWDATNPYKQELSSPEKDLGAGWKGSACFTKSHGGKITLIKEKVKPHEDDDFDKSKWPQSKRKHTYQMDNIRDAYDVSKYKGKNQDIDSDYWQFTLRTDPKLIYFPHNYLGNKYQEHAADFAIFEVDFEDENVAKLFTRDFYGKYDREKGTLKDKALNFFADPLHKTYTNQQLLEEDIQFWMAGYPTIGHSHKASTNYNINRKSASRLVYRGVRDENDRLLLGHMQALPAHIRQWTWQGKRVNEVGYWYSFNNPEVEHGASGSLVTMGNNDVIGVYSYISSSGDVGGATPLRNMEIKDKSGKIIFHAYDFVEGVAGQKGSYKEQVQKYILKEGKQTSLSKLRNWRTI